MRTVYDEIIVIGSGAPAVGCAGFLASKGINFNFFDSGSEFHHFTQSNLRKWSVPYTHIGHDNLVLLLKDLANVLILSVNNMLLFPPAVVDRQDVTIINYHNSLLPFHRGVRAESWAIFAGDTCTGITWHLVDNSIDLGDIICQAQLEIGNEDTAFTLLKKQSTLAVGALKENFENILTNNVTYKPQLKIPGQLHLAKDVPWGGLLNQAGSEQQIWNFLRAMDYGKSTQHLAPQIKIGADLFTWGSYQRGLSRPKDGNNCYHIPRTEIYLKGLKRVENS